MDVYLEIGRRRVFAGALEWPGWIRSGRDEPAALQALVDYAPRYQAVLGQLAADLEPPGNPAALDVVERLDGDATTDFGAPGAIPAHDAQPPDADELAFLTAVMQACWSAFDRAAASAAGRELAPAGPRGGGRSLDGVRDHVLGSDAAYGRSLGARMPEDDWPRLRAAFVDALGARARGELPDVGPRGGRRWPARYAVRRAAWHLLDHAWEIEDRVAGHAAAHTAAARQDST